MKRQTLSGNIVDVVGRRIFPGRVEWAGGRILRIVPTPGRRYTSQIAPGFVDAHIHIESSLLPPSEFARLAVVHGTVATVSDPHEIANVLGAAGVRYMIADARRSPLKFNFGAPSCVPATDRETAGAVLDAVAVEKLLALPEVRYLSEVMNYPGVLGGDPDLLAKIAAAKRRGKAVDGHAPGLRGAQAAAYAAAGITTDHECFTLAEARDKIAAGMKILIREGSAAKNFDALAPLLRTHPESCMFCCDDLHPDLLLRRHLDEHVRRALASGASRLDALACASLHPVRHYGLDVGLLQPGDPADFIVFEGWKTLRVRRTYIDGVLVARAGRSLLPRQAPKLANVFRAKPIRPDDFRVSDQLGRLNVIEAIDGQLITRWKRMKPKCVGGAAVADPVRDLLKMAVVNRYAPGAPVAVGFIRGFGLREGALASSVAHDSHNIVAVGTDDESLAAAVNLVIAHKGGLAAVGQGAVRILPLPIAGLMADGEGRAVAAAYTEIDAAAKALGSPLAAPFMTLSFMALLVIPDLKLSDRGLFSGAKWASVPLFEEKAEG
ncbi:MAG: adenine deaminase [Opitutaceae bacterium]|nr:adenine deaminase [Opitutaceae bacterium]